jgi:hypothetical protein
MNIFILPIILIILGGLGIAGTIWLSKGYRSKQFAVPKGSEWFSISPEVLESELSMRIQEKFRRFLKIILIWMIALYRRLSKEITVKQVLKKKVREFLYDHTPEGVRHPSDFWHRVRHTEKKTKKSTVIEKGE